MPKTTWAPPPVKQKAALPQHWAGLDVAAAGADGAAVDLVPVAGKVTVFDFWATWCRPCEVLDRELADLSRRYPGRMAVRKLNVVDWDSPAAVRYLEGEGYGLPHIEVYAADGRERLVMSGPPVGLVRELEAIMAEDAAR